MKRIIFGIVAVLAMVAPLAISSPANAQAYRTRSKCGDHVVKTGSNRWGFFFGHRVDVDLAICTNGTFVFWGRSPHVTFPSTFPPEPLESIEMTDDPHIIDKDGPCTSSGAACAGVTWTFIAHESVGHVGGQDFAFSVHVYPVGYQVCAVGGSCDSSKVWNDGVKARR